MFNPYKKLSLDEIVPSEEDDFFRYSKLHGYVHDEGAAMLEVYLDMLDYSLIPMKLLLYFRL